MPPSVNPEDLVLGARVAGGVYDFAKEQHLLDRLIDAFRKKHRVLVLGSAGAGKTNMIKSLTQDALAVSRMTRTRERKERSLRIRDKPFIFIDTPGDVAYKSERIRAIQDALRTKTQGIINVVSYGYHEAQGDIGAALKADQADPEYLEERRKQEIDRLAEWVMILGGGESANWLLTVITKADLWWNQKDNVFDYYNSGPYDKELGDARSIHKGTVEYCSVMHKFFDKGPLAGTFDDADRLHARRLLLERIIECTEVVE